MRVVSTCSGVAVLVVTLAGCTEDPATAMAAERAGAKTAAKLGEAGVKNVGRGESPQRGPGEVYPPGALSVEFEPQKMNFGLLPPGADVRGTSRLWNTGTTPLTIVKSITSCGCTTAEDLAGRVIPPGGYTEYSTQMHMKSGLGEKMEKITIYFAPRGDRVAIQYFTAEVVLPVRLDPPMIAASKRVGNEWEHTMTGTLEVSSLDGKPFTILASHGEPPDLVGFDPAVDKPRSKYTLRWDLTRFQDVTMPWFWVIETDHPDAPLVDARIQHSKTLPVRPEGRPWVPKDQRVLAGIVQRDSPFEIEASIEYHHDQVPEPGTAAVTSESPELRVKLLRAVPEGQHLRFLVEVTVTDDAPDGLLYGTISLHASRYSTPVFVIARVAP